MSFRSLSVMLFKVKFIVSESYQKSPYSRINDKRKITAEREGESKFVFAANT